jgi:hypothetical protein
VERRRVTYQTFLLSAMVCDESVEQADPVSLTVHQCFRLFEDLFVGIAF